MIANVISFSSRPDRRDVTDPRSVVLPPVATDRVDLTPPTGTEISVAEEYINNWITADHFVYICNGDQRRAGRAIDAYIRTHR